MALCLAHLLRMYGPNTPFSHEQLKVELLLVLCCTLLPDALPLLRLSQSCCVLGCLAFIGLGSCTRMPC